MKTKQNARRVRCDGNAATTAAQHELHR